MVRELNLGGCERDLVKVAIGLDREQFTPFVGCFLSQGFRADELRDAKVPVIQFPVKSFASLSTLKVARQFGQFVAGRKIKIVHTFDIPSNIFGVPAARWYGVPVVISSDLSYRGLLSTVHRNMVRMVDPLAHKIVVNSAAVGQSLERNQGIAASKIYLSYNGVDVRDFYPAAPDGTPEFLNGSLVIGTLCALRKEKRVDLLIDAFPRVHKLRADAKLLIVGSGDMLPSLKERCRSLGLEQSCLFQPAVQDAARWLRMMDIFVLTSESESFPNAVLEAMACGRCVVASDVGGVPELITNGRNGLTFPSLNVNALAESLERVAQDPALRAALAAAAARTARENFTIELAVKRMQDLYLSLYEGLPKLK
jgi:glycosyltransferase involved in cell wall biosynthesis